MNNAGVHDLQSLKTTDPRHLHDKLGAAVASKMVSFPLSLPPLTLIFLLLSASFSLLCPICFPPFPLPSPFFFSTLPLFNSCTSGDGRNLLRPGMALRQNVHVLLTLIAHCDSVCSNKREWKLMFVCMYLDVPCVYFRVKYRQWSWNRMNASKQVLGECRPLTFAQASGNGRLTPNKRIHPSPFTPPPHTFTHLSLSHTHTQKDRQDHPNTCI